MITQSEFARRHGVKRQSITGLVRRGLLSLSPEGLINEQEAIDAFNAKRDPSRQAYSKLSRPDPPAPIPITFHEAKTRDVIASAQRKEYELAALTGDLLSRADTERRWSEQILQARSLLLALPAHHWVPAEIKDQLKAELIRIMRVLERGDDDAASQSR